MMIAVKFLEFIRWKDWARDKIFIFCTIWFYISLVHRKFSISYIEDFFIFIVFVSSLAIYGYLINDLGDRNLDRLHCKRNSFENLNREAIALVFLVILCVMTLSAMAFVHRSWFLPLWIIQVFVSTFYSIPPLRFKERGAIGLIFPIVAQYPLPVALIFAALGSWGGWDMIFFILWVTVSGSAMEIGHQKFDFIRDSQTKTGTFAVRKGYDFTAKIYGHVLQLDKLSIGVLIAVMVVKIPWVNLPFLHITITPILPFVFIYILLYIQDMRKSILQSENCQIIDPYYSWDNKINNPMQKYLGTIVLLTHLVIPIYLAGLMTYYYHYNVIIFMFLILWLNFRRLAGLWK